MPCMSDSLSDVHLGAWVRSRSGRRRFTIAFIFIFSSLETFVIRLTLWIMSKAASSRIGGGKGKKVYKNFIKKMD